MVLERPPAFANSYFNFEVSTCSITAITTKKPNFKVLRCPVEALKSQLTIKKLESASQITVFFLSFESTEIVTLG